MEEKLYENIIYIDLMIPFINHLPIFILYIRIPLAHLCGSYSYSKRPVKIQDK